MERLLVIKILLALCTIEVVKLILTKDNFFENKGVHWYLRPNDKIPSYKSWSKASSQVKGWAKYSKKKNIQN